MPCDGDRCVLVVKVVVVIAPYSLDACAGGKLFETGSDSAAIDRGIEALALDFGVLDFGTVCAIVL